MGLTRSRAWQVGAIVVALAMAAVGFLPLFGGPGYEAALACGLLVPGTAAVSVALALRSPRGPLACLSWGIATGLSYAGIALAVSVLHGLRVGLCDLGGGVLEFVLTGGAGTVMGGAWGAVAGEIARGRKWRRTVAVVVALAAPVASIVVGVARFVSSPMIFAFDPFVGYFSGALYDTVIDTGGALYSYRAGSLATLAGGVLAASVLVRDGRGRLRLAPIRGDEGAAARAVLAVVAIAASLGVTIEGAQLGHWQTRGTIARTLAGFRAGPGCDVVFPDGLAEGDVALLLRDCNEELAAVESYLGAEGSGLHVTAFFFRDAAEKKRLMGAGDVYIAKPWRREVYLQLAPYPHPVLGHELAHVVAGTFAPAPFHVAGALGGAWPNPGLIEGVAVATSPDAEELTDREWARAMRDLGILPPVQGLFSFGFLGENSSKAYTIAGAFVGWVVERWGIGTVRAWYGGGSIEALARESWADLDRDFRASLDAVTLSPEALAYAKAKFAKPSVFGRTCPHVVDALRREGDRCRDAHQDDRAIQLYDEALARDAHDEGARFGRGFVQLRYGDRATGRAELEAIAGDDKAPQTWRDRSEEALADADLLAGDSARAAARYAVLAARTVDEDAGRTLEVKRLAALDPAARGAVVELLLGAPDRPADSWVGALEVGRWDASGDGVAEYLAGRNLGQRGRFELAAPRLDAALRAGVPTTRLRRELVRQRAIVACALADRAEVTRLEDDVQGKDSPFDAGGRREWTLRLLARCAKGEGGGERGAPPARNP